MYLSYYFQESRAGGESRHMGAVYLQQDLISLSWFFFKVRDSGSCLYLMRRIQKRERLTLSENRYPKMKVLEKETNNAMMSLSGGKWPMIKKGRLLHGKKGKKETDGGSTCTLIFSFPNQTVSALTVVFHNFFVDFSSVTWAFLKKKVTLKT